MLCGYKFQARMHTASIATVMAHAETLPPGATYDVLQAWHSKHTGKRPQCPWCIEGKCLMGDLHDPKNPDMSTLSHFFFAIVRLSEIERIVACSTRGQRRCYSLVAHVRKLVQA